RKMPASVKGWAIAVCWFAASGIPEAELRFHSGHSPERIARRAVSVHGPSCVKTMPVFAWTDGRGEAFQGYALKASWPGKSTRPVKREGDSYAMTIAAK